MRSVNWFKKAFALFFLCAATAIAVPAQTLTTLHSFDSTHGASPYAGLIQATDGNFYGTTWAGGNSGDCMFQGEACGTVFKIAPSGALKTLHSFCAQGGSCPDGAFPTAGLIQAKNGNLYGTTFYGGANNCGSGEGCGTVFQITPSGKFTTLHTFCSQTGCPDGANPSAGLMQATDGNLYGTTEYGGPNTCYGGHTCGTVFKITPSGTLTTLYSFCSQPGCSDGEYPEAALIQAPNGNLYGTTYLGGNVDSPSGTIFKITPSGTLTTIYSFTGGEGANPAAGLVQATDGNFYGTTVGGGTKGYGTVFRVTPSGTLKSLYNFCSNGYGQGCTDGGYPRAGLVQATDGSFYGTTASYGGGYGEAGTVFKITPNGRLTTLYSFCPQSPCVDGAEPEAGLIQATEGNFYGTTVEGGSSGTCSYSCGTVFSLSVGLGPFVETQPAFGKVGTNVEILGTNLTGATSVTFNGTPAVFTVLSSTLIKTTVPAGATTGKVQVVTPNGTLSSNVRFRVGQ